MANNDEQMNESPLANRGPKYLNFPVDEYTPVCVIAYMVAPLKPNPKFSKDTTPIPSVRFLLAGLVKDPDNNNEPTIVRKWTGWKSISYNEKSGLVNLFKGVPCEEILQDDKEGGKLWTTPFKALLELSKDGKYTNITRVKLGDDVGQMNICYTAEIEKTLFKTVKAYAAEVPLEVAVIKMPDGVKKFFPADLKDAPVYDNDNDD
jgi:hypothetical protein